MLTKDDSIVVAETESLPNAEKPDNLQSSCSDVRGRESDAHDTIRDSELHFLFSSMHS